MWIRGFPDMAARKAALTAFYTTAVWKAHRDEANATMYDSDNVLLLRPARDGSGFQLAGARRVASGSVPGATDFVTVTIYHFAQPVTPAFVGWFDGALRPVFERAGAAVLAELVTEHSENTFPGLPVRAGESVFVWVARFDSRLAYDRYLEHLAGDARWSGELFAALHRQLAGFPELLVLDPTPRSLLGHRLAGG